MKISENLRFGRENATSIEELEQKLSMGERIIRERIKTENRELARRGYVILSSSRHKGYWLSNDREEIGHAHAENLSRINALRYNDQPFLWLLSRLPGQTDIR